MTRQYRILLLIISIILVLGLITSVIVRTTWFKISDENISYIGLSAPLSGMESGIGSSMEKGARLYLEELNHSDRFSNRIFKLKSVDTSPGTGTLQESALELTRNRGALAVISYVKPADLPLIADIYKKSDIPVINTSSLVPSISGSHDWLYTTMLNPTRQSGFVANYVRNVMGKKIITIVHSSSDTGRQMQQRFADIYAKFGTKIHYTHEFSQKRPDTSLAAIVETIKEKKDLGTIFFAGNSASAARFVVQARDAGIKNAIVGTDAVGGSGFTQAVLDLIKESDSLGEYINDMVFSVPLLFDTAGGRAQQFKNRYMEKYGTSPDWIAAYSYDAAKLAFQGISQLPQGKSNFSPLKSRRSIKKYLNGLVEQGTPAKGITGEIYLSGSKSKNRRPVQVGSYNGKDIIAAPTQLQPLKFGRSINYFEELKKGKILYVNDRFMYKTNVIYTGIELHKITKLDMEARQATLDFSIWFRYQGKFDPADIEFLNAAEDITLETPVESSKNKNISFKLYRVKAPFRFNFLGETLPYGKHMMGFSFHHKTLNRNNVIYVVDVLGMEFNTGWTLKQQLDNRRVLDPSTGWRIDRAWLSQRIFSTSTLGSPAYVGYGTADPDFSRIDFGVVFSEDQIDFRTIVNEEYLIYIGIFGLIGSLAATLMDRRLHGFFWRTSSWVIRLVFWPHLLLSVGNLCVFGAIRDEVPIHYIEKIIMVYDTFWWLLPATLLIIALERFLWVPLENRTRRKVPNLIRHFTAGLVYVLAFCGIIAFVWDQTLTSVLATSGVFAMIVGLAIQGNISNVFSGIILNLERPFSVGDWIKINQIDSVNVVDMTWRTVRLETLTSHVVSIPNGQAADSVIVNYSKNDSIRIDLFLQVSPKHKPEVINRYIKEAIADVEGIDAVKSPVNVLIGIKPVVSTWIAEYTIRFWVISWKQQFGLRGKIWDALWDKFQQEEVSFNAVEDPVSLPESESDTAEIAPS